MIRLDKLCPVRPLALAGVTQLAPVRILLVPRKRRKPRR